MKWLLPCILLCFMFATVPVANAQEADSTGANKGGLIDSLKHEMKRIENSYRLLKQRTDTTQHFTEADRLELEKLSQTMTSVAEQIREMMQGASTLANDAGDIYGVKDAVVHEGDYTIEKNDVVETDVKVLNGDAFIYGTLDGSIIVVNGDAYVRRNAKITGDIVVVNGRAHVSEGAAVDGSVMERGGGELEARQSITKRLRLTDHPELWQDHNILFERVAANYNRVEGLFLGLGQNKEYYWSGVEDFSPYGFAGYAFSLHRWRYQIGLDKWFGNENRFEVGIEGHSLTDSKDDWIIGPKENFLYSVLAKEDFMDYFSRDGMSVHVAQYYEMNSRVTVSFNLDKYSSLSDHTNWSIFGGHKIFRPNPAITDGWMRSIVVDLQHRDYTGDTKRTGWMADLRGESTISGAFDFKMVTANVVRYQPLFRGLQMNVRLRAGTSDGVLPLQRSYQIGGFNSLNAFPYKEFSGNRLLLCNLEFLFNPELFKHSAFFPLNTVTLILFGDVGQVQDAGSAAIADGWQLMNSKDFKSDFGVGLGNGSGSFRIYLAWRTDISASPTFGIRVARPF
jgi:Omp85 superfamily domain